MKVSDAKVRAWIETMVDWHGPEDGKTPNSPVTAAFLRGAFLNNGNIATYAPFDNSSVRLNLGVRQFLSFIEGAAKTMRDAGVKGVEEDGQV